MAGVRTKGEWKSRRGRKSTDGYGMIGSEDGRVEVTRVRPAGLYNRGMGRRWKRDGRVVGGCRCRRRTGVEE